MDLILFACPIWLPWILSVAEGCPRGIGTQCCLWQQIAQWAAEGTRLGCESRYLWGGQTLWLAPTEAMGTIVFRAGQ